MRELIASVGLMLVLSVIVGCGALGLTKPANFDQSLAQAYGTHTAVVQATDVALNAGSISVAEATLVQQQEKSVRAILDVARQAEVAGDTKAANSNLALALTGLTALQTYLNNHGGK